MSKGGAGILLISGLTDCLRCYCWLLLRKLTWLLIEKFERNEIRVDENEERNILREE